MTTAAPDVLYSAAEIAARVDEMAEAIAADLGSELVAVPILTGAMVFAADLVRALWHRGVAVEIMPMRLKSYGAKQNAAAPPVLTMGLDARLEGKTALLIDGVCDVGATLVAATEHLKGQGAARIASVVVIDKPVKRKGPARPDYIGFSCDDLFVVGYGMDAAGALRHLPYVGVVR